MLAITLPNPDSAERSRLLSCNSVRRRALERLYERREAIDHLIGALERYQQTSAGAVENVRTRLNAEARW